MTKSQNPAFNSIAYAANFRATGLPLVLSAGIFMRTINLVTGESVFVDDEDYELVSKFKWYAYRTKYTNYARRVKQPSVLMHRILLNTPKNVIVDHKDHNGLNNQRSNIRNCTRSQNQHNKSASGRSKYLGVCRVVKKNKNGTLWIRWMASICVNGKHKYLGSYLDESHAALAYNRAAEKYHGEFANPNKI